MSNCVKVCTTTSLGDASSHPGRIWAFDGLGSTYVGALPGLRIDYVLGDIKSIEFCSHKVLPSTFSDHNPVYVRLYSKI